MTFAPQILCLAQPPEPRTQGNSNEIWGKILQVFVRDNNVDQALKVLKRKVQREGVFREMKRRRFWRNPRRDWRERKAREFVEYASSNENRRSVRA
jgi:small subunit ribosomal protein S21